MTVVGPLPRNKRCITSSTSVDYGHVWSRTLNYLNVLRSLNTQTIHLNLRSVYFLIK